MLSKEETSSFNKKRTPIIARMDMRTGRFVSSNEHLGRVKYFRLYEDQIKNQKEWKSRVPDIPKFIELTENDYRSILQALHDKSGLNSEFVDPLPEWFHEQTHYKHLLTIQSQLIKMWVTAWNKSNPK